LPNTRKVRTSRPSLIELLPTLVVVGSFAVRAKIEALPLFVSSRAKTHDRVNQLVEDCRHHATPHHGDQHRDDLDPDLRGDREVVAAGSAEPRRSKYPSANCPDDTTYPVDAEHIQRVIITSSDLHHRYEVVAGGTGKCPKDNCADRAHRSARRRHRHEPG